MRVSKPIVSAFLSVTFLTCLSLAAAGQTLTDGPVAAVMGGGSEVRWEVGVANNGGTLTISFPDGRSMRKTFRAGVSPAISVGEKYFDNLPDGTYTYELQLAPAFTPGLKQARSRDDESESERNAKKRPAIAGLTQSGSFAVVSGSIIIAGAVESEGRVAAKAQPPRDSLSSTTQRRIRYNHRAFFMPDQVIPDDLIVQGSLCVGLDCVNNEPFNFDTIRMKENNTRILFLDTSTAAGFPTNDWIIRANSSASGGGSFLAFVDHGNAGTGAETGTIVFQVDAGAPANSLRVSSSGNVGVGTATPVLDVHANTSDTPAIRLEQNNTGGFAAQTWDIAGNEANFFVRDVTSGSRLPFRIRPGAPTSSIDISATGNVGIATGSPGFTLDVSGNVVNLGSENGTNTRTNNTTKLSRVLMPPFTTTNLNVTLLAGATTSTANIVAIGGEVVGQAAATQIDFFTGATTNTDTGTNRMMINSSGQVGIATTSPTQTLSVNGTAGKPGGGSWDIFSDERLKNIKGRFSLGLKAVMQLQPLRYEYKPNNALDLKSPGQHVGFSAQELQRVIPDAVSTNSAGYLMVNNDPILWTMLNAIKEQQAEIVALKEEVRKLRASQRRRR